MSSSPPSNSLWQLLDAASPVAPAAATANATLDARECSPSLGFSRCVMLCYYLFIYLFWSSVVCELGILCPVEDRSSLTDERLDWGSGLGGDGETTCSRILEPVMDFAAFTT